MTKHPLVAFFPLLVALPLSAQDAAPAAELAKLKPLAGHWKGSGTASMAPGSTSKWTAQVKSEWVLGGHWLMTDSDITFEDGPRMRFREYLGWDRENQRYVQLTVNSMCEGVLTTPHFVGDDTMVVMMSMLRQGSPEAERVTTKFGGDQQSFAITFLEAQGQPSDGVQGTFQRAAKVEPQALEAAHATMPTPPEMAKIGRMAGTFAVTGEMRMAPDAPVMKIRGTDTIRSLFDGAIVQVITTGTADGMPGTYDAHAYYAWDAADRSYEVLVVSNMGEVMSGEARFVGDDSLVQTFSGLRMGQPSVARSILTLDAAGKPVKIVNHSCSGTAAPMQDFTGTYEAAKGN